MYRILFPVLCSVLLIAPGCGGRKQECCTEKSCSSCTSCTTPCVTTSCTANTYTETTCTKSVKERVSGAMADTQVVWDESDFE